MKNKEFIELLEGVRSNVIAYNDNDVFTVGDVIDLFNCLTAKANLKTKLLDRAGTEIKRLNSLNAELFENKVYLEEELCNQERKILENLTFADLICFRLKRFTEKLSYLTVSPKKEMKKTGEKLIEMACDIK